LHSSHWPPGARDIEPPITRVQAESSKAFTPKYNARLIAAEVGDNTALAMALGVNVALKLAVGDGLKGKDFWRSKVGPRGLAFNSPVCYLWPEP